MDSKTCKTVLSKLLEVAKEPNITITIPLGELEHVFGLSGNDVKAALSSLNQDCVVKVRFCPSDIVIRVLPAAFGYFKEKQEEEQVKHREKWGNRRWDLLKIGAGYALGLLTAWIKSMF